MFVNDYSSFIKKYGSSIEISDFMTALEQLVVIYSILKEDDVPDIICKKYKHFMLEEQLNSLDTFKIIRIIGRVNFKG